MTAKREEGESQNNSFCTEERPAETYQKKILN